MSKKPRTKKTVEAGLASASAAAPAGDPVVSQASAGAEPSLVVIGPRRGRRRAGRQFGPEPVTIPLAELSDDEIAAIKGDPALTVTEEGAAQ